MVLTVSLKLPRRFIVLTSKYSGVFYGCDEPYCVSTHSANHGKQAYLHGTGGHILQNLYSFHSIEVLDRVSKTQSLQVDENSN